jgi:hypothetical protein
MLRSKAVGEAPKKHSRQIVSLLYQLHEWPAIVPACVGVRRARYTF